MCFCRHGGSATRPLPTEEGAENSAETKQSGRARRSEPEIIDGRSSAEKKPSSRH